jgi:hypothetical protein
MNEGHAVLLGWSFDEEMKAGEHRPERCDLSAVREQWQSLPTHNLVAAGRLTPQIADPEATTFYFARHLSPRSHDERPVHGAPAPRLP